MKNDDLRRIADEKANSGDYLCAIEYYQKYLEQNPQDALICNRIGFLYGKLNQSIYLEEQVHYFKKALEIKPDYTGAIRNLALTYPLMGKNNEAVECFHQLFKLEAVADDYFAYACLKIKLGDFEEGWKYYDSRFSKGYGRTEYIETDKPFWDGQNIFDKTLLVQYEQGFGDSLQFFRFLQEIKPFAKKVIFRVQNELVELFKANSQDIEIISNSVALNEISFDYHIPLMSLVRLTRCCVDSIPLSKGYIKADENKINAYKKEFFDNDYYKIGITWHGMPTGNQKRNIPLEAFYPLSKLKVNGKCVKVYSFQKDIGSKQLEVLPPDFEIIDLGKTFKDFSDTAAAMENVDLFVTSDNSVLNLAGAMGKKTFLLLNRNSEWRWFFDEGKTLWYDSVRIFKKENENDSWDLVMQKVISKIGAKHVD